MQQAVFEEEVKLVAEVIMRGPGNVFEGIITKDPLGSN
jgi:hypothetical protein